MACSNLNPEVAALISDRERSYFRLSSYSWPGAWDSERFLCERYARQALFNLTPFELDFAADIMMRIKERNNVPE